MKCKGLLLFLPKKCNKGDLINYINTTGAAIFNNEKPEYDVAASVKFVVYLFN